MIKVSELTKPTYKPGEVAEMVGVTTKTLRVWDSQEPIFVRDPKTNRRYMSKDTLVNLLDKRGLFFDDTQRKKRDVIYARVSSRDQKKGGDLDRQAQFLIESVPDLQNPLVLKEVGSGLNDKRKKLLELIALVVNNRVNRVFVTYRDRLTRFGFNYLETVFNAYGVEIVTVKQGSEKRSVEQELVDDMMALIVSFSGKLYGLRGKKQ